MSRIYVTESGASLSKRGGQYLLERENETICEIPSASIEGITVIDSVHVTSAVLVDALRREIPFTWLSSSGYFYGQLLSTRHQNVCRQEKQFSLRQNTKLSHDLARMVVFDKVYNQMAVLRRYNRKVGDTEIDASIKHIRAIADHLHEAHTVEAIMGYEGSIAREYFSALSRVVPEEFFFTKRTKQPPTDPFNSLLSFGYTLLLYDFYNALIQCGLHPYVGFLHALRNGHPACASDLMEPWRPAVIDSLCLSLVSRKEIKKEHFQPPKEDGAVFLDRVGRRIFLRAYEKRMQKENTYLEGKYSWRHTILMACQSFGLTVETGELSHFKPLVIR